jgi:predicted RNA-binding Zn ribbon-like protein
MERLDGDWIGGYLFVGNRLALDFLNTRLMDGDQDVEKLPDWAAFSRWCVAAGIGPADEGRTGEGRIGEIRGFRERLREAVTSLENGKAPAGEFLAEVNSLLSRYPARVVLDAGADGVAKRTNYEGFWGAMAAAVAELLTSTELHRLRKCEHCIVHFYDVSKKGSRRWCSMGMCGNRVKVAAYQKRRREEG